MIIGLAGFAGSGKDEVGKILVERHGFRRLAFADALKAVAYDADPQFDNGCEALSLRSEVDYDGWDVLKKRYSDVREFLQNLGVACRRHLGDDVWVRPVMRTIADNPTTNFVITDCRFPNEASAVAMHPEGFVVRVHRPNVGPVNGHESESALDAWPFDSHLYNDSTKDMLAARVTDMVSRLGILQRRAA